MATTNSNGQERVDKREQILQELPGFHLNRGEPCLCGVEALSTRSKKTASDSLVFYHHCTQCGTDFSTWIEG